MNACKEFKATWGDGYVQHKVEVVHMDFFRFENGYDIRDIESIKAMPVGHMIELNESGAHTVERVL